MQIKKSNSATSLGGCLVLAVFCFTPVARSQSSVPATAHPTVVASMQTRSDFATRLENQFRQGGIDARVQLDGDSRDTLRIEGQQLGRRDVYCFVSSLSVRQAKQIGFSAIVFSNGKQQWNYALARESMISSPVQP